MEKRLLDITGAFFGLLLLWPLFLGVAAAIRLDDGGPVFFRQLRVGRYGRTFRMWKFRTMVVDAERRGAALTVAGDARITRIGHLLRHSKVDELPQLLNVLVGEMSLVGPRPEVPRYVALYTAPQARVLDLMPGITDPASITYRDENRMLARAGDPERAYLDHVMPEKIRLNLDYAARATVLTDLAIIGQTLGALFRRSA